MSTTFRCRSSIPCLHIPLQGSTRSLIYPSQQISTDIHVVADKHILCWAMIGCCCLTTAICCCLKAADDPEAATAKTPSKYNNRLVKVLFPLTFFSTIGWLLYKCM